MTQVWKTFVLRNIARWSRGTEHVEIIGSIGGWYILSTHVFSCRYINIPSSHGSVWYEMSRPFLGRWDDVREILHTKEVHYGIMGRRFNDTHPYASKTWFINTLAAVKLEAVGAKHRSKQKKEITHPPAFLLHVAPKIFHTVDGSDIPNNHLGCIPSLEKNGKKQKLPQLVDRRISEPSTAL